MWQSNPTWGSPRIAAELHKLEIKVAKLTVEKYKPCGERSPSATWRTFLELHSQMLAIAGRYDEARALLEPAQARLTSLEMAWHAGVCGAIL